MNIQLPTKEQIDMFFTLHEQWSLVIERELLWVLTAVQSWFTLEPGQWEKKYSLTYAALRNEIKKESRSFSAWKQYLEQYIDYEKQDDIVINFEIDHSIQLQRQKEDNWDKINNMLLPDFDTRNELIVRYNQLFENTIPAEFYKSICKSIPVDATDIFVHISLSIIPQDDYSEEYTEFEYAFYHEFKDSSIEEQEQWFLECYTCKDSEEAYKMISIINTNALHFWDFLNNCDEWFDDLQLERIIEDIPEKEIIVFDKKLHQTICLFYESSCKEDKNKIAMYIAQNNKRNEFLHKKQLERSITKLQHLLKNRLSDKFNLVLRRTEKATGLEFILPENKKQFVTTFAILKEFCSLSIASDYFDNREKVVIKVQCELVDWNIIVMTKFIGDKTKNQKHYHKKIMNQEQLFALMQQVCPTYYWMDYSLDWVY
jgi:hypothetical protein